MDHQVARSDRGISLVALIRAFAGASLAAIGFAFAILAIGAPFAAAVGGLHHGLSWLVQSQGETSAAVAGLVSVASVAAGAVLAVVVVRLLLMASSRVS